LIVVQRKRKPISIRKFEARWRESGAEHDCDDPNFRAMVPATQRFFLNAVFFGPGH
jgi:hypothetical protein